MSRISKLNSGRVQVTSPSNVNSDRYNWLSLDSAEPNLGTSGNGYVLTSNTSGSRIWTNNLSISNVTANTITANYFYGNAAFLTGLASSYGNIDVGNFLQQYTGNLTAGNIVVGNIVANSALINGNLTAEYLFGNAAYLTGIDSFYSNVNVGSFLQVYGGNIQAGNIVANSVLINGNITAEYFFGNGSQLTGMNTYSNVQVATFLELYSGNISARDANFSGNVIIGGNLFVNGNVTYIGANNLVINDSLIYLADDNPADTLDIGFISSFTNPGYQHTGFVRDATDGIWKLFANVVAEPGTTVDFTNATYSNLKIGNLIAYNISGTITTASQTNITAIGTLGSLNVTGNVLANNYVGGAVNVTGNVIAANVIASYFIGNGALLSGLSTYGNVNVASFLQVYAGNISADIISANSINVTGNVLANNFVGGAVNVTGNVLANNFVGSGALLTALPGYAFSNVNAISLITSLGLSNYSNVNVKAYTETMGFQNYGNVNVKAYTETMGFTNYSNVNVKAYTETMGFQNYGNTNVKAYTETMGFTNYSNVNLTAYLGGAVTIGGNLTVNGNLFVNGNVTTINANNLNISDSMIYLADDNPSDILDIGFVSSFTNPGYQHTGFVRDASDGVWKLFANVVTEPTTTVDFTNATYSNLQIGSLTSTGFINTLGNVLANNFVGRTVNVTGNVIAANVTASYFIGNGALLTGLSTYSNVNVSSFLEVYAGNISANNISANSINVTGNVLASTVGANYVTASTATFGNIAAVTIGNVGTQFNGATINLSGNVLANAGVFTTVTVNGNETVTGYLNVTGNVIAANVIATNFIGNGALLTGLAANYGNIDVGNFLQVYTGNISANNISANNITVTGNISGTLITPAQPYITSVGNLTSLSANGNITTTGYYFGNGSQLSGIVTSVTKIINGNTNMTAYDSNNIAVTINGSANTVVFTSSGIVATGNITASYYFGNASFMTGLPSTGNIQFNNTTITSNTDITLQTLTNGNIYLNAGGTGIVQIVGNDALGLPAGNDADRPLYPEVGYTRFNTDSQNIEFYDGNSWVTLSTATISSEVINPDGVANTYTLGSNTTVDGVLVSINGTLQRPTYSYTIVNNNQIVFTEIPLTSDIVEVRFIAGSTSSVSSLRFGPRTAVVLDSENVNITGNIILNGSINNKSNTLIPNVATTTIDSYNTTSWRTVKYIIQAVRGSNVESYETLVTHNGTTAVSTTYGVLTIGNTLGNVSASLISGNVEIQYTPLSANTYLTLSRDFYPL